MDRGLEQIMTTWQGWLAEEKRFSDHTISAYRHDFDGFLAFIQEYEGTEITVGLLKNIPLKTFRAWLSERANQGYAFSSTARALAVVRSFYRYAEKHYQLENAAIFHLRTPKQKKSLPKALSQEQAGQALEAIADRDVDEWVQKRDIALLTLIYGAGLAYCRGAESHT